MVSQKHIYLYIYYYLRQWLIVQIDAKSQNFTLDKTTLQ